MNKKKYTSNRRDDTDEVNQKDRASAIDDHAIALTIGLLVECDYILKANSKHKRHKTGRKRAMRMLF